jgi:hypothetical protein
MLSLISSILPAAVSCAVKPMSRLPHSLATGAPKISVMSARWYG